MKFIVTFTCRDPQHLKRKRCKAEFRVEEHRIEVHHQNLLEEKHLQIDIRKNNNLGFTCIRGFGSFEATKELISDLSGKVVGFHSVLLTVRKHKTYIIL